MASDMLRRIAGKALASTGAGLALLISLTVDARTAVNTSRVRLISEYSDGCKGIPLNKLALRLRSSTFRDGDSPDDEVINVAPGIFAGRPVLPLPALAGIRTGSAKRAISSNTAKETLTLGDKRYVVQLGYMEWAMRITDENNRPLIERKSMKGRSHIGFANYDIRWAGDLNGDEALDVIAYWWEESGSGYEVWISDRSRKSRYVKCSLSDPNVVR